MYVSLILMLTLYIFLYASVLCCMPLYPIDTALFFTYILKRLCTAYETLMKCLFIVTLPTYSCGRKKV